MPRRDDDEDLDDRPRRPRRRRDEDDDRDEPVRRKSGGSNVALIVGGTILGIFAICGGVAAFGFFSYQRAVKEAHAQNAKNMEKMWEKAAVAQDDAMKNQQKFLQDKMKRSEDEQNSNWGKAKAAADAVMQSVKARRYEALHEGATAAFQKRVTVEQLKKLIDDNAEHLDRFRRFEKDFGPEPSLTATTQTYSEQLMTARGFKTVKVTMVSEMGEWKLDQFLVEAK